MKKVTFKSFVNHVLTGTAQGTIIALIPNAVLSAILSYFTDFPLAESIIQAGVVFQMTMPLIMGALIAKQFDLSPMQIMVAGGAAFVGSGVIQFDPQTGAYIAAGTGDVINIMLTSSIAVIFLLALGDSLGSSSIIGLPILAGVGAGVIGMLTYPYVTQITYGIGQLINQFTNLQPVLMAILISCTFALLIISPITTVGIGLAIGLDGIAAGAAALGVAATTIVLVVNSWKVNKPGITLAIALGGMKMMMPNLFKTPIIILPCLLVATVTGICAAIFPVLGTAESAGFGLVGLVGPLAGMEAGLGFLPTILVWLVIPVLTTLLAQLIFERLFHLYDRQEVFKYHG